MTNLRLHLHSVVFDGGGVFGSVHSTEDGEPVCFLAHRHVLEGESSWELQGVGPGVFKRHYPLAEVEKALESAVGMLTAALFTSEVEDRFAEVVADLRTACSSGQPYERITAHEFLLTASKE